MRVVSFSNRSCLCAASIKIGFLIATVCLPSCKPKTFETENQSITGRQQQAGKWLATVAIGGNIRPPTSTFLSNTLKEAFSGPHGGQYSPAIEISDASGSAPDKNKIISEFRKLEQDISAFKKSNPTSPTMVVIGLTGHGFSNAMIPQSPDNYVFVLTPSKDWLRSRDNYFTGEELASLVGNLKADETLVFVQSCGSGELVRANFVSEFAQVLAIESTRKKINISVITPVHEFIISPENGIENHIRNAIATLARDDSKNVVTYARFKDQLLRNVCSDDRYYPRNLISSPGAIAGAVQLNRPELIEGLDPQFFENIDPALPLFLTAQGLGKWMNGSLDLSRNQSTVTSVAVSESTLEYCKSRTEQLKGNISAKQRIGSNLKLWLDHCKKSANFDECIAAKSDERPPPH